MINHFLLALAASVAAAGPVPAEWRPAVYSGPASRPQCVSSLSALRQALDLVEARAVDVSCSGRWGLRGRWEALWPRTESPASRLIAAHEGLFPGLQSRWRELSAPSVSAQWQAATLMVNGLDGYSCQAYAETFDYLWTVLPVRNISQTVFCGGGPGMIQVRLEYLQEDGAAP